MACYVVREGVVANHVRRAQIDVDSATTKYAPQNHSGNAFDELGVMKASRFIDEMQNWITVNVEDVSMSKVIKVDVVM